ncbi:MAG: sphingosine-phosphate lyase [Eubacterium sp.]|nr:sphingosine-phosphate lyase [Eubacterium sp.]
MLKFPKDGTDSKTIFSKMDQLKERDGNWKEGKTWSLVYYAGEEITKVAEEAYLKFFHANALNPAVFNSLRQFENDILSMAADLFHGDEETAGSLTSGGSESILMAVKTYRDEARVLHPEIKEPEMILPVSAHASFEKAAHYYGVKAVHIPLNDEYKADIKVLEQAITPNTILIVGSAPAYPQGIVDPIAQMGQIALKHGLRFHVDACLGGFILPFVRDIGYQIPDFDFSVPGVSSISADLHKYGFAAKGVSAILYRNSELRRYQYFAYADWPGGLFVSPSATGTRPGGAIASAYAVLNYLGRQGYQNLTRKVMTITKKLQEGISRIPELFILGKPEAGVFAFGSDSINIHALADKLEEQGWVIDQQSNPDCLHFMVTPAHEAVSESFLRDLRAGVDQLKTSPETIKGNSAALYGMKAALPSGKTEEYLLDSLNKLMGRNE